MRPDLSNFGVKLDTLQHVALEATADNMDGAECISILSAMSIEQKKYACGYLAMVMAADGEIAEKEAELWKLISLLASFPTMTLQEEIQFWQTH